MNYRHDDLWNLRATGLGVDVFGDMFQDAVVVEARTRDVNGGILCGRIRFDQRVLMLRGTDARRVIEKKLDELDDYMLGLLLENAHAEVFLR